ncbi:DCN1-like protein 3 isoform X3 [Daktulosphaira vitifoliae]|uniref:DCN1-like protein 3 isoform X3 n=1 Tax=Daktulosphaira vitifoliae TaxID=58002 RepID=UPI0021AA229F|nr:DCN1-like protein 3 isoform X3 [Daktulosphaira vitifoliae]
MLIHCFSSFYQEPSCNEIVSPVISMNNGAHNVPSIAADSNDNCSIFRSSFTCTLTSTLNKTNMRLNNFAAKSFQSRVQKLFDCYKDSVEDLILIDGIERLCSDLQMSPEEFRILVLAWKCDAHQMCRFTRTEFINGCSSLQVDTIPLMKIKLTEMTNDLNYNNEEFKSLYRFTFKFGLDNVVGQRILPVDTAIVLWQLVFSKRKPAILQRWLTFLETQDNIRGIPKDTWNMFLNFAESVFNGDLSNYDDTEAWPSIFDDFVEYENDQANQNISDKGIVKKNNDIS